MPVVVGLRNVPDRLMNRAHTKFLPWVLLYKLECPIQKSDKKVWTPTKLYEFGIVCRSVVKAWKPVWFPYVVRGLSDLLMAIGLEPIQKIEPYRVQIIEPILKFPLHCGQAN